MDRSIESTSASWAIWIVAILAATAAQTTFAIGRLKWLKRKSRIDEPLTARVRRVTKRKHLRVCILKRKSMLEAFACPTGEIFITEDLYQLLTFEEALAVTIHEAGHVIYQTQFCGNLCKNTPTLSLIKKGANPFLSILAGQLGSLGSAAWHERLADSYAVKKGYGPNLSSALEKLYRESEPLPLTLQTIPSLAWEKIDRVLHIHPQFEERLDSLANTR
ncbi:MAG: M48 family metalloprotease [Verrucomicrobia bacterium]|nr:M48 family metalloprotease [Verrucomicrobiota bacterium]